MGTIRDVMASNGKTKLPEKKRDPLISTERTSEPHMHGEGVTYLKTQMYLCIPLTKFIDSRGPKIMLSVHECAYTS